MSENGKYFNSASENEQWLKEAIDEAIPHPSLIKEEEIEGIYHESFKIGKDEYFPNFVRADILGSTWDINPIFQVKEGTICHMYNKNNSSDIYYCIKGSILPSFDIEVSDVEIDYIKFLIRATNEKYPVLINSTDEITYLVSYQEIVDGAHLIGHNVVPLDENGDPILGKINSRDDIEIDGYLVSDSTSISNKISNLQLILLDT